MTAKDWTMMVIASERSKPVQPVHLQKALFLLSRKLTPSQLQVATFYEFEPYDYGPFCSQIYSDAEALYSDGYVHIDRPPVLSYALYCATEEGYNRAATLRAWLAPEVAKYLEDLVAWTTSMPFKRLVSAIYREFPDMKVNSVFKE